MRPAPTVTSLATALRRGLLGEGDDNHEPLVGLVARVFILGSLPHSEPNNNEFHRSFGDQRFRLSLLAPRDVGLPYGRIPRLILSQLTTQAVRERSPELVLASSFRSFCDLLGVPPTDRRTQRLPRADQKATHPPRQPLRQGDLGQHRQM